MKRSGWWLFAFVGALALLWMVGGAGRQEEGASRAMYAPFAASVSPGANDLLVDLADDASLEQVQALARRFGLTLAPNSRFSPRIQLYRAPVVGSQAARLLERLRAHPLVERAELDMLYAIPPAEQWVGATRTGSSPTWKGFPNDPQYRYQWHLEQIQMPRAWPLGQGDGAVVAVIDTGVAHRDRGRDFKAVPDLAGTEFVAGYDFVNDRQDALDDHGHGTHVAGTIAQSTHNGVGVAGVAFKAKIMPLKVLSKRGFGNVADIAEAVRFAADHGAHVINMSLGGPRPSKVLGAAVDYARSKGVVVVCAAGNDGQGQVSYPAAYRGAVGVAATQYDRATTFYSNWGKEVDLAAPGGNTRLDQNNDGMPDGVLQNTIVIGKPNQNDYLLFMGTSMAAPHVAGAAALLVSAGVGGPDAIEDLLKSTAKHPREKSWDEHYGAGIVDAHAALVKARGKWNGYRLGLGALLSLVVLVGLRRRGALALRPGLGMAAGLLFGAAGLFFLPLAGFSVPGPLTWLTHGFPAWDAQLFGSAAAHSNPLFYSALAPLALATLFYGVVRLRGLVFGFTVGVAAHLLFAAVSGASDVSWVPNVLGLDSIWLLLNGLACMFLAALVAKT